MKKEDFILKRFFFTAINKSIEEQDIILSDAVKFYLLNIFLSENKHIPDYYETFAEIYLDAIGESDKRRKISLFKTIGDLSLIKTGIFPSRTYGTIRDTYYKDLGAMSYGEVFSYSKNALFGDLSINYDTCVDAIHGVMIAPFDGNLLSLLEFYKKTESKAAKLKLIKLGYIDMNRVSE